MWIQIQKNTKGLFDTIRKLWFLGKYFWGWLTHWISKVWQIILCLYECAGFSARHFVGSVWWCFNHYHSYYDLENYYHHHKKNQLYVKSWVGESTNSWHNRFRKLYNRYEKKVENYLGLVQLSCCIIIYRKIILGLAPSL